MSNLLHKNPEDMTTHAVFEIIGFESPDVFQNLERTINDQGAAITYFQQSELSAPMTGDHLFHAKIIAFLPETLSRKTLMHAIEDISPDLAVLAKAA